MCIVCVPTSSNINLSFIILKCVIAWLFYSLFEWWESNLIKNNEWERVGGRMKGLDCVFVRIFQRFGFRNWGFYAQHRVVKITFLMLALSCLALSHNYFQNASDFMAFLFCSVRFLSFLFCFTAILYTTSLFAIQITRIIIMF